MFHRSIVQIRSGRPHRVLWRHRAATELLEPANQIPGDGLYQARCCRIIHDSGKLWREIFVSIYIYYLNLYIYIYYLWSTLAYILTSIYIYICIIFVQEDELDEFSKRLASKVDHIFYLTTSSWFKFRKILKRILFVTWSNSTDGCPHQK